MSGNQDDDGPEIIYVPGAQNHYKYEHDVIVLDERLKNYPKAHEYIKSHELKHAKHGQPENRGVLDLIRLEFQTDVEHFFSRSEEIAEVREYFEEKSAPHSLRRSTSAKFAVADYLRGVWNIVLRPLSPAYRKLADSTGEESDS